MTSSGPDLVFPSFVNKPIRAAFDGPAVTSDAGLLFIAAFDREHGITEHLAACLFDDRDATKVQHTQLNLFRQRVYQIAAGYEDANDADTLRMDPALKMVLGRTERQPDLASQPTLSRFENRRRRRELFKLGGAFIDLFIKARRARKTKPKVIVIDLDGTEDEVHGAQQLSLFNGYFRHRCYHPLVAFATVDGEAEQAPLGIILRSGRAHAAQGTLPVLRRLVDRLRAEWPGVEIRVRLDGGFAVPEIYDWLETEGLPYTINLPKNDVLKRLAAALMEEARGRQQELGGRAGPTVRLFGETTYAAASWSGSRRVIIKAEVTPEGDNPRFLVTNVTTGTPEERYRFYTKRGDAENRLKEYKSQLHGDRTSCHRADANQFRLFLHLAAYMLWLLVRMQLRGTALEKTQVNGLILALMKVGATVTETSRGIRIRMSQSYPGKEYWKRLAPA